MQTLTPRTRPRTVSSVPRAPRRRKRTTPDFDRVIEIAADMISQGGEANLRIPDVRRTTGISNSSLYAHFGGRDGVVSAALLLLYERHYRESLGVLESVVREATSEDDYLRRLRAFIEFAGDLNRTPARLHRAAVFAGSQGRPDVRAKLVELTTHIVEDAVKSVELARTRGFVRSRHSSRVITHLIQAAIFGRLISSFDAHTPKDDLAEWTDALMCAIVALSTDA